MADTTTDSSKELEDLKTKLKKLESDLAAEKKISKELDKELRETKKLLTTTEQALDAAKSVKALPEDNTAMYAGKLIRIDRTVEAKFALDEVKKGFIPEDVFLLVPKK